jgi:hypothetical protein
MAMRGRTVVVGLNGDDPIHICVRALEFNGVVYVHGETYRRSELREVLKAHTESFQPWYSTTGEKRAANKAIVKKALEGVR